MRILPLIAACAAATALAALPVRAADAPAKVVTVITSADAQTQLMGMVLTMQAIQGGASAHMLLCGPGGDIALKNAPQSATAPQPPMGMSPQGLMQKIRQAGGRIEVCALYLPGKNATPDVLLDGITVAKPPAMAAKLMDPNARVLSF